MTPDRTPVPVLIRVDELARRLRDPDGTHLVLADVRWTLNGPPGRPAYEAGHLPGAHWVDLETELSAPASTSGPGTGGRHPLPDPAVLQAAMRRIGVRAATEVVVYDAGSALAAARLWWLLLDAGHERVRVLEGGFATWQSTGQPVRSGPDELGPRGDFMARPGQLPRASGEEIAGRLRRGERVTLVDVRAPERFTGRVEPIDPVGGHIPGAVNRPSMANLDSAGHFLAPAEISQRYAGLDDPVLYCGSGITAAHSLLALRAAGVAGGRIYPGSWSDWITDPDRPVATGPAEESSSTDRP